MRNSWNAAGSTRPSTESARPPTPAPRPRPRRAEAKTAGTFRLARRYEVPEIRDQSRVVLCSRVPDHPIMRTGRVAAVVVAALCWAAVAVGLALLAPDGYDNSP